MERTFTTRTDLEAILLEQALAKARELEVAPDAAPDGQVLAVAEMAVLRSGRELTRRGLEANHQHQAEAAEERGPAPAAGVAASRTRRRDAR